MSGDAAEVQPSSLEKAIHRVMTGHGYTGEVGELRRLSGGANMESWRFSCGSEEFVLRRAPSAAFMAARPLTHGDEAQLIRTAHAAGVPAPEVIAELAPEVGLGTGFIMRAIAGTADPKVVLLEGGWPLLDDLAAALARIHSIRHDEVAHIHLLEPSAGLDELTRQFEEFGRGRPIIALGLAWLRENLPRPVEPCLIHGDFRTGNFMAKEGRLTGVLDWELAHRGDYHQDLAFGCMAVWTFGRIDAPAFGLGAIETYFASYQRAGGRPVNQRSFKFWLIYSTVWWALGCLEMAHHWRGGADRSLERVVVSRRSAEQELDLLMLLESEAPPSACEGVINPVQHSAAPRAGEATIGELATAVQEWLAELKPRLSGHDLFQNAVARNALGIIARASERGSELRVGHEDDELAIAIIRGEQSLQTPGLLVRLRKKAFEKVTVDMPRYPAVEVARARWIAHIPAAGSSEGTTLRDREMSA